LAPLLKLEVMPQVKVKVESPDPVLKRNPYADAALARIAHVNEAIRLVKVDVAAVGPLPASVALTGATIATLKAEVEIRLDNIEEKLNALIAALS
jgi:hypothetical protein